MPSPVKITLNSKTYITPILNNEMEQLANQINEKKLQIKSLNDQLNIALQELTSLSDQFLAIYIQQTGSFPN